MGARALISMTNGQVDAELWTMALAEQPRLPKSPKACKDCPLAIGGDWEAGATAMLAELPERRRVAFRKWSCHTSDRACAGMIRIVGSQTP